MFTIGDRFVWKSGAYWELTKIGWKAFEIDASNGKAYFNNLVECGAEKFGLSQREQERNGNCVYRPSRVVGIRTINNTWVRQ